MPQVLLHRIMRAHLLYSKVRQCNHNRPFRLVKRRSIKGLPLLLHKLKMDLCMPLILSLEMAAPLILIS